MPEFIPGLKLSEIFYTEAVSPLLAAHFPRLAYSAGRLDYGSDVLGFDTPQSRDHGWGPKITIFVNPQDYPTAHTAISTVMAAHLPFEIRGYPTHFDRPFHGEALMQATTTRPVQHWVAVTTIQKFFNDYLGANPLKNLTARAWLLMPQQHLRTIAAGRIFHDGLAQLNMIQKKLNWYPPDLWLYLLANQWRRIDQEEPFMARCGDTGDELGSRLVAMRLVDAIMRLAFLMERQYRPYTKWFGTAFGRLACAEKLNPLLTAVFDAKNWQNREAALSAAYLAVMEIHNNLGLTPHIDPEITPFFDRPYQVPHADRFVAALHAAIQTDEIRNLPPHIGSLDQFVDSTDILSSPQNCKKLGSIFSQVDSGNV